MLLQKNSTTSLKVAAYCWLPIVDLNMNDFSNSLERIVVMVSPTAYSFELQPDFQAYFSKGSRCVNVS